jgi:cytosine/uracil/thiamine/allantoin permease
MAKGIWEEIKSQPSHVREFFMWVCVVGVFSVIGFAWFKTTSTEFVALVNPEQARENSRALAQNQTSDQSPFATILNSTKGLWANIAVLFDFTKKTNNIQIDNQTQNQRLPDVEPNLLPLSGNK